MSRGEAEPVFIAEYLDRGAADHAWAVLTETGIPAAVITDDPPWGPVAYRVQVARRDASAALVALNRRD